MTVHNEIKITPEDLHSLLADEWEIFQAKIIGNCYCGNCHSDYNSTIVNYEIYFNDINDIVLHGKCADCGSPIARYVETGETKRLKSRILKLRQRLENN